MGSAFEAPKDRLKASIHVSRIGRKSTKIPRPILVKLNSVKEIIEVLRAAKNPSGTTIYLKEDLTQEERASRKWIVAGIRKA